MLYISIYSNLPASLRPLGHSRWRCGLQGFRQPVGSVVRRTSDAVNVHPVIPHTRVNGIGSVSWNRCLALGRNTVFMT